MQFADRSGGLLLSGAPTAPRPARARASIVAAAANAGRVRVTLRAVS